MGMTCLSTEARLKNSLVEDEIPNLRVIRVMYLAEPKGDERPPRVIPLDISIAVTALAVIALGVWPKALLEIAYRAGQQIF